MLQAQQVFRIKVDKSDPYSRSMIRRPAGPLSENLRKAVSRLKEDKIEMEKGPYADEGAAVSMFCNDLMLKTGNRIAFLEKIVKMMNDPEEFGYDDSIVLEDELVTAGRILTQKSRYQHEGIAFVHDMEPLLLAIGLLRRNGIESFPAFAVDRDDYYPLIAIFDLEGVPLLTCSLSIQHPPLHLVELDIVGDGAMVGITHAMYAENTVRKLGKGTITEMFLTGELPSDETEDEMAAQIGDSLYRSHSHWPHNPFIGKAVHFMEEFMIYSYIHLAAIGLNAEQPELRDTLEKHIRYLSAGFISIVGALKRKVEGHLQERIRRNGIH